VFVSAHAPNPPSPRSTPAQGRQLLWGWIQEHRRVPPPPCECDAYSYAGCVSTPRLLFTRGGRLHQTPLPELALLRSR
jgi:sucrose-6-phosphate hydrolase SacC (GH32 family)